MFRDIIGHSKLKYAMEIAILAARKRNEVFGHCLVQGMGGLGKTHILNELCKELGYYKAITQGNRLTVPKVKEFLIENSKAARNAGKPLFAIIDEIHEMTDDAQDELYYPMDKGEVLTLGQPVKLGQFCLAGATTDPQELDGKSLVDRFIHNWYLKPLDIGDLVSLVSNWWLRNETRADWPPMQAIAERSRGIPRLAIKYARKARDYASYKGRNEVIKSDVERIFEELGIDSIGLDEIQRKYLTILYESDKPIGKDALASMLGEIKPSQLTNMVEPYLWQQGFITSSSRGRELTERGFQHLAKEDLWMEKL